MRETPRMNNENGHIFYKSDLNKLHFNGKTSCPYCKKTVSFIYDKSDARTGAKISTPCPKCNNKVLLDLDTMQTYQILDDVG